MNEDIWTITIYMDGEADAYTAMATTHRIAVGEVIQKFAARARQIVVERYEDRLPECSELQDV